MIEDDFQRIAEDIYQLNIKLFEFKKSLEKIIEALQGATVGISLIGATIAENRLNELKKELKHRNVKSNSGTRTTNRNIRP
jgi:hypothetical protein